MNSGDKQTAVILCLPLLILVVLMIRGCGVEKETIGTPTPSIERVSTVAEFDKALAEHAANLDEQFRIQCTPDLRAVLMEPSSVRTDTDLLGDICGMNGYLGRSTTWDGDTLEFQSISYYEGWRILNAVREGRSNSLDARERETLRIARALIGHAPGSPLEKERYIHDALCARVEYYKDDGEQGDKDCAIGALLNGKADCDGYADAMALCCGLAEIPCRYMIGKARETGEEADSRFSKEAGHMWNLVKIADRWVSVDVTWDDQTNRISYFNYNLGTTDASLLYLWNSRALLVEWAEETDSETQLMPDQRRIVVHSLEDVYFTARKATVEGVRQLTFLCTGALLWQTAKTEFFRMLACGGWGKNSSWKKGRMLEVTNLQTKTNIVFCDTEEDALHAIGDFASAGEHSFSLYFRPALADALFAEELVGLKRLLSSSLLENPDSFHYSRNSGSVSMENATFLKRPLPVCHSENEIRFLLRGELAKRPAALVFLLPDGFDFTAVKDRVFDCVYSMGVKQFAWVSIGNRIRISNLEYHSEFRFAETREDVEAYLRSSFKSGKTDVRVFCSPELYSELKADNVRAFWEMLEEAGYGKCSVCSNDRTGMLSAEQ